MGFVAALNSTQLRHKRLVIGMYMYTPWFGAAESHVGTRSLNEIGDLFRRVNLHGFRCNKCSPNVS